MSLGPSELPAVLLLDGQPLEPGSLDLFELLVLDEATSALDLEGERELLCRLRAERPGLSLLLVSHRRASLEICDRVVHLEP
jgi:ABC-type transport system involved in cytochrome bd biosynthesis fused ATPase/permease subunit